MRCNRSHFVHSALKQTYRKGLLALMFFAFSKISFSCDCPLDLPPVSVQTLTNYDVVFYGKVDSVSPCTTKGIATAYFTITELYKGKLSEQAEVNFDCSSACMMSFGKCDEWLIYGHFQRFDEIFVNFCEHCRKVDKNILEYFNTSAHWSIDKERTYLKENIGLQHFVNKNAINEEQEGLKGRNEQPSNMNKLWLLVISLGAMGIVYFVTRRKKNE